MSASSVLHSEANMKLLQKCAKVVSNRIHMVVMNYKATVFNQASLNMRQADHQHLYHDASDLISSSLTLYMKLIKRYHKVVSNLNLVQGRLQDSTSSMKVNLTCIIPGITTA